MIFKVFRFSIKRVDKLDSINFLGTRFLILYGIVSNNQIKISFICTQSTRSETTLLNVLTLWFLYNYHVEYTTPQIMQRTIISFQKENNRDFLNILLFLRYLK